MQMIVEAEMHFFRPTCDLCNTNYVTEKIYPALGLQCNRCWQTRLAGVIRSDSVLKPIVTNVVVKLGESTSCFVSFFLFKRKKFC